jgi:hypothetical protein
MMWLAIPEGAAPLAIGTALALGGLSLVLSPLLSDEPASTRRRDAERSAAKASRAQQRDEPRADGAIAALREIEFDRETGKLSDVDYAELKQRYTQSAIDEMRAQRAISAKAAASAAASAAVPRAVADSASADPAEAAIERARAAQKSCDVCGPRPEPDAEYCSTCGLYLAGACGECGAPVELAGSRFCTQCGEQLAAL